MMMMMWNAVKLLIFVVVIAVLWNAGVLAIFYDVLYGVLLAGAGFLQDIIPGVIP